MEFKYCAGWLWGNVSQLLSVIILAPAHGPVGGGESCHCGLHRCFLYGEVIGLRGCYPCVCFYSPAISSVF